MSCTFGRGKAIRAAGLEKPATGVASTWWPSTPSAKRPFAPANFQEATKKNDWLHDSGDNYLDTHRGRQRSASEGAEQPEALGFQPVRAGALAHEFRRQRAKFGRDME